MPAIPPVLSDKNLPPLIIAGILLLQILAVHAFDRWILRGGLPHSHVHAKQQIGRELEARFQQGVVMLHAKQYDHALTAFHRVVQLRPTMPEAHVNLGFALLGLKKYKEAQDFFATALSLRPEQINAYYGAALAAYGMHERQDALHAMYHYISLGDPADPYRAKAEELLNVWREELRQSETVKAPKKGNSTGKPALTERQTEPAR